MTDTTRHQIVIVGGGPAGLAAALHIARLLPSLAPQIVILEAAQHPRSKLCGGGVTFHGEEQLRRLGLTIEVPAFVVHRLVFRLGARAFATRCHNAMRIIERAEFDAALAAAVRAHDLRLYTNERVLDMFPSEGGIEVVSTRARYHAAVVVGADGANSIVRRKMKLPNAAGLAPLLRTLTPVNPQQSPIWQAKTAVFDFSCISRGIQGYAWDFPCLVNGQAYVNRGIFDSRIDPESSAARRRGNLAQAFAAGLQARNVNMASSKLEGHPVRWFNPEAVFAQPRVLLAGDAAGVDPLFAEGISYAMEYGEIVAEAVKDAFAQGDFTFRDYRERLLNHRLGRLLKRRTTVAKRLYHYRHPHFWSMLWRFAAIAPTKMQRAIGASLGLLPP